MNDIIQRTRRARGRWTVAAKQWRHDRAGEVEFIHLNKTGGSSIEKALNLPFSHQTAQDRLSKLGVEEWNRRYSFTFVRNPWDRLVSQYHYRRGRDRLGADLEFKEWVKATLVDRDAAIRGWPVMFLSQVERISGTRGQILVDEIFRFESFQSDFDRLCGQLGIARTLPHKKPSSHQHYSCYYDDSTADIVADAFAADVDLLGYGFDRV